MVAVPQSAIFVAVWGLFGVLVLVGMGILAFRFFPPSRWIVVTAIVLSALLALLFWGTVGLHGAVMVLALEWCLIAGLILTFLLQKYANRKPSGTGWVFLAQGILFLAIFLVILIWRSNVSEVAFDQQKQGIAASALLTIEILFIFLGVMWFVLSVSMILNIITGYVVRQFEEKSLRPAAVAAINTGWVTLAIPAVVFLCGILAFDAALAFSV